MSTALNSNNDNELMSRDTSGSLISNFLFAAFFFLVNVKLLKMAFSVLPFSDDVTEQEKLKAVGIVWGASIAVGAMCYLWKMFGHLTPGVRFLGGVVSLIYLIIPLFSALLAAIFWLTERI